MRLAGQSKLGFFPAPSEAVEKILEHLTMPSEPKLAKGVCALDPCCGEGLALRQLTEGLEIKPERVYAVELDGNRARIAQENLPKAKVKNASYTGMHITQASMGLIYLNPPFDSELGGGKREEYSFLLRASIQLAPGGIMVFVLPFNQLARNRDIISLLDMRLENLRVHKFPEDHRKFGEVVVFGVKRKVELPIDAVRNWGELTKQYYGHMDRNNDWAIAELGQPYIPLNNYGSGGPSEQDVHVYCVPPSMAPHTFQKNSHTPEELQKEIKESSLNNLLTTYIHPPAKQPPLPLGRGHVALQLASGHLDGLVSCNGNSHIVRGTSRKEEYVNLSACKVIETEDSVKEIITYSQRIVMTIRVVGPNGKIITFTDAPEETVLDQTPKEEPVEIKATVVDEPSAKAEPLAIEPPKKEPYSRSYKVACWTAGDGDEPSFNRMRYAAKDDAERAGYDLLCRWTAMKKYEIHPSDDEPNDKPKPDFNPSSYTPHQPGVKSWKIATVAPGHSSVDAIRFKDRVKAENYAADKQRRKPHATITVEGSNDEPNA